MSTKLSTKPYMAPALFDDFFTPWSEFFGKGFSRGSMMTVPPVNVMEKNDKYLVSLAAPGFKKEDFKIDIEGNMLTVSSEKEENKQEEDDKYTRNEYNFMSFSRSFTIPEDVKMEGIDAHYEDGVLKINMPRINNDKKTSVHKMITVK